MSNFAFLQSEWPLLFETATQAEGMANTDARASCFYVRRALEPCRVGKDLSDKTTSHLTKLQ